MDEIPAKVCTGGAGAEVLLDGQTLAASLGITPKSLIEWVKEGLPIHSKPSPNRSVYELKSAVAWARANKWEPRLDDRGRKLKAEADLAELERDQRAGELIPLGQVGRIWRRVVAATTAKLLALPSDLASQLAHVTAPEADALLSRAIRSALEELSVATVEAE